MELSKSILNAIVCGPVPVLRPIDDIIDDPQTKGEEVIAFAACHLIVPNGMKRGSPLVLEPFQQAFILSVLDFPLYTDGGSCREATLSVAARNGKTFVIAVILLAYLIGPLVEENTNIASGAMSRDQAGLCFTLMHMILMASPDTEGFWGVVPSSKKLFGINNNTTYQALSADAKTGYGGDYKVILLDEAGQVVGPRSDFTDMLESRQGSHDDALFLTVSTQGRSDLDFLSQKIDTAIREQDPETVCHLYTAAPKDGEGIETIDLMDEKAWESSNPGLGVFRSRGDLAKNMRKATQIPEKEGNARNQYLNQRTSMTSLAIGATLWKNSGCEMDLGIFQRNRVVAGVDLSRKTDLTAFVMAAEENGICYLLPLIFCPTNGIEDRSKRDKVPYDLFVKQGHIMPVGGNVMDYDQIAETVMLFLSDNEIEVGEVHYDKHQIDNFQSACDRVGVLGSATWIGVPQFFKDMGVRLGSFTEGLLEGRIKHNNNKSMNTSASVAIARGGREGISALDKDLSTHRIDPLVAAVMAAYPFGDGREAPAESFDVSQYVV